MRRCCAVVIFVLFLFSGCDFGNSEMNRALSLREQILKCKGCTFDAVITADYDDKFYTFSMHCQADASGAITFQVSDPESISGVSGTISEEGGQLSFLDTVLAFELLADGQLSPVSAPWIFLHTLRSGYLNASGEDGTGLRILIDDSYAGETLLVSVWTDENDFPIRSEITWKGRRILTVDVRDFVYV